MTNTRKPLALGTSGLDFSRFGDEDIKKLSVKRIHASPALDTLLGPVPGGLYDPALGAVAALDRNCTTCGLSATNCAGHCGHIQLPVPCYHPQYIDTTLRLLRAKCIYCHRFRLNRDRVSRTICALRLLHHGLVEEYIQLEKFYVGARLKSTAKDGITEVDGIATAFDDGEDVDDVMERREKYVNRAIKKAKKRANDDKFSLVRNPVAVTARKNVIADFIRDASGVKQCSHCGGITPSYRKDRSLKIFRRSLQMKAKEAMRVAGKVAPNPLVFLMAEQKQRPESKKPLTNGWHEDGQDDMEIDEDVETHGAEDEIALQTALQNTSPQNGQLDDQEAFQSYMTPNEVHAALTLLFDREQEVLRQVFGPHSGRGLRPVVADMFFMNTILVPPNRYRPLARESSYRVMEAQQNGILNRIIQASNDIYHILHDMKRAKTDDSVRPRSEIERVNAGIILQEAVNTLIDAPTNPATNPKGDQGVKQKLEKKEGLFRMQMMGKRVNYAARSVISPDPNVETNEIGVPMVFAKKLTYPEPVTSQNFDELSKAVINGHDKYPGASAIENETGQVMSLRRKTLEQRKAIAKQLLTTTVPGAKGDQSKKVYRHLMTGDVVIMNRQPTLHKPSMMGHRVRVLTNEKTIRMHYANCNTYNADFDGDEMNMHFPQNELARAEALMIADTDHQYLSATAGKPLRGLIQDHISMGVQFTSRDTFFDREQYHQLLYNCLRPEGVTTIFDRIQTVPPMMLKPRMLWTGKQVITTILKNITPPDMCGMNLTSKSSTASENWGESTVKDSLSWQTTSSKIAFRDTEQIVIFQDGEHLTGILDKAQMGPSAGGLIHSVYEIYGSIIAGNLLSILGRLLTRFLNERAWSCGMDDLYLTPEGDQARRGELSHAKKIGHEVSAEYVTLNPGEVGPKDARLQTRLENVLRNDDQLNGLDQVYKSKVKSITDNVSRLCLPNGLRKPFPKNQMQAMTLSGAKGSSVNANLISCNLGQQVLEGRRVPTMVSGKTLPSFLPFETDPVAGGYVSGRFLTGIKPQEYFFHAMSGREGLIDTAVKTAKSGYLQRCIIKGLEGLKTEYDTSVREVSNGSLVQFLYGEDGLEVIKQRHLKEFKFLAENNRSLAVSMEAEQALSQLPTMDLSRVQKDIIKSVKKRNPRDPLTSIYMPATNLSSTSESFAAALNEYVKENPDQLIKDKKTNPDGVISKKTFQSLMDLKYMKSIVDAGEAVGVVAAQSVGEPSTQMTLNTFHLAGHSAKNVTLGIPRLREIIMTASHKIMTPTMTLKPIEELSVDDGSKFAKSITKLPLAHVINDMSVTEKVGGGTGDVAERLYDIRLELFDPEEYTAEYAITVEDVLKAINTKFLVKLDKLIKNELKRKARESTGTTSTAAVPDIGTSVGRIEEARPVRSGGGDREAGEDQIDEDADMDDARDASGVNRRDDVYDEPDDSEIDIAEESDSGVESDDEDQPDHQERRKPSQAQNLREQNPDDSGIDMGDSGPDEEEHLLRADMPNLKKVNFLKNKGKTCRIVLSYDVKTPKLLLLPMLEDCARTAFIHFIPGLGTCTLYMEEVKGADGKPVKTLDADSGKETDLKEPVITTEGVNLLAMRDYQDIISPHSIYTNSVHDMLKFYGVEAARMTIIKEIDGVFKGHGISVDGRHLNLIADAMTVTGQYLGFSRHGVVKESGSVLAKMSYETVMTFLREAVLHGENDPLLGPSARIVAGQRGQFGTGSFDVIAPLS